MKTIKLTESDLLKIVKNVLNEQSTFSGYNEPVVYTDEKEYKKALKKYNFAMQAYKNTKLYKKLKDEYYDEVKKVYPNLKITPDKKYKKITDIRDSTWETVIDSGNYRKEPNPYGPTSFNIVPDDMLRVNEWISKHKSDPVKPSHFEGGGGHYRPIYEKPTKPIFKKPEPPKPIKQNEPIKNQPLNTISTQVQTLPKGNTTYDSSVYGPAKSLIGFMRGRDFITATGEYLTYMNKVDKDLINNKRELEIYLRSYLGGYLNKIY